MVAGESGRIRVFVKSDIDPKKPYIRVEASDDLNPDPAHYKEDINKPMSQLVYTDIGIHKINSVALSPAEDTIVFTTSSAQILKIPSVNLERPNED